MGGTVLEKPNDSYDFLVAKSEKWKKTVADLSRLRQTKLNILIQGETGTGKSTLAKFIHRMFRENSGPFLEINSGIFSNSLLTLGTRTTAFLDDLLRRSASGTIFFDDITTLSVHGQQCLHYLLHQRHLNNALAAQFLCGSSQSVLHAAKKGRFDQELFHLISGVIVTCPSLRNRPEDIPILADLFFRQTCHQMDWPQIPLPQQLLQQLSDHPWPGNVRQLKNLITNVTLKGKGEIKLSDLPKRFTNECKTNCDRNLTWVDKYQPMTWKQFRNTSDKAYLSKIIGICDGNISQASRLLEVDRTTLHKWIKAHNIARQ